MADDKPAGLKLGDLEVVPCRMVLGDVVQNYALDFKEVNVNHKIRNSTFTRFPDTPQAGVLVKLTDQKASQEDEDQPNEDEATADSSSDSEEDKAAEPALWNDSEQAAAAETAKAAKAATEAKSGKKAPKKTPKPRITNKDRLLVVVPGIDTPLRFNRKDVALFIPTWPMIHENSYHEYHTPEGAAAVQAASEDAHGQTAAPPRSLTNFKYYLVIDIRSLVRTKHAYAYQKKPVVDEKLAKYTARQAEAKQVINRLSEFTVPRSALRPATKEALASTVGFANDAKRLMVLEGMLGPVIKNGLAVRIDKGVLPEQEEYERFIYVSPKSGAKSTVLADFARAEEWLRMCLTKAMCVMHISQVHNRSLKFSTHVESFYKQHDTIPGYPGAAYRFKANDLPELDQLGRKTRFTWQAACGPSATMVFADHETEKDNRLYLTARIKISEVALQPDDEKLINVREFLNAHGNQQKKKKRASNGVKRQGKTVTGDAATNGEVSVDTLKDLLGDAAPEVKVAQSATVVDQALAAVDAAVHKAIGTKLPLAPPPLKRAKRQYPESGDGSQVPPNEVLDQSDEAESEQQPKKKKARKATRKPAKKGLEDQVAAQCESCRCGAPEYPCICHLP